MLYKSNLLTLETIVYSWYILMSVDAGAQEAIIFLEFGPCVVKLGQVLYLGRAPRIKETLPNFCERCRVPRH